MAAAENSNKIILEINENLPRVFGGFEECIHISEVDMIVEGKNEPVAQLFSPEVNDIDRQVAKLLMPDFSYVFSNFCIF